MKKALPICLLLALALLLGACRALSNLPKASQPAPTVVSAAATTAARAPTSAKPAVSPGKTASQDTAGANTKLPEEAKRQ